MEVRVIWMADGDEDDIARYLSLLDRSALYPGPTAWVANALDLGGQKIDIADEGVHGLRVVMQILAEGPETWLPTKRPEDEIEAVSE